VDRSNNELTHASKSFRARATRERLVVATEKKTIPPFSEAYLQVRTNMKGQLYITPHESTSRARACL